MHKPYFQTIPNGPPPLRCRIDRHVRFDEVDSMGIVWHGRYAGYFEEGRVALGHRYGISYSDFISNRFPVPVRQLTIDFLEPLFFEDKIEIETILHWSEAARLNFEYAIRKDGRVVCTGSTVQLLLNDEFDLLLAPPPFYVDFMDKWRKGLLGE
jgi:acyl-CoA thioester hydrolase